MEKIFILGKNNVIYDVNQKELFNDIYNLGKQIYDMSDGFSKINIYNWDKEKTIKRTGEATESLTKEFINFINEVITVEFKNEKESIFFNKATELDMKYHQYHFENSNEILLVALYVYVIEELINLYTSIEKNKNKEEIENHFIYGKISKERILIIIKNIVNSKLHMEVSVAYYEFSFEYIFHKWWEIAYLDIFRRLNNIKTSTPSNKIIPCRQCGILFAQQGKETLCGKSCKKENDMLRKQKSRKNKKVTS